MPRVFRVGSYWIYFWVNEGLPLEPVHVHVAEGGPVENATKIWITKTGKTVVCNNRSRIPEKALQNIRRIIESRSAEITDKWFSYFGEIQFFC